MAAFPKSVYHLILLVAAFCCSIGSGALWEASKPAESRQQESTYATYSAEHLHKYVNLQAEETLSVVHYVSVPGLKKIDGYLSYWVCFEPSLQLTVSSYIHASGLICRGLTNRDIIFPFHYFW